jgi:hypothetical protein
LTFRQLQRLDALDDGKLPIAELHRRWSRWSVEHGLTHPSYERTRVVVHELRALRRQQRHARQVLLDIVFARANPLDLEPPMRRS